MSSLWDAWDERVQETGRVSRTAGELSNAELLALLASERSGPREFEKAIIRQELMSRLGGRPYGPSEHESEAAGSVRA